MFLEIQYRFSALGSSVLFPQASAKARLHFESTDLFAKAKKRMNMLYNIRLNIQNTQVN